MIKVQDDLIHSLYNKISQLQNQLQQKEIESENLERIQREQKGLQTELPKYYVGNRLQKLVKFTQDIKDSLSLAKNHSFNFDKIQCEFKRLLASGINSKVDNDYFELKVANQNNKALFSLYEKLNQYNSSQKSSIEVEIENEIEGNKSKPHSIIFDAFVDRETSRITRLDNVGYNLLTNAPDISSREARFDQKEALQTQSTITEDSKDTVVLKVATTVSLPKSKDNVLPLNDFNQSKVENNNAKFPTVSTFSEPVTFIPLPKERQDNSISRVTSGDTINSNIYLKKQKFEPIRPLAELQTSQKSHVKNDKLCDSINLNVPRDTTNDQYTPFQQVKCNSQPLALNPNSYFSVREILKKHNWVKVSDSNYLKYNQNLFREIKTDFISEVRTDTMWVKNPDNPNSYYAIVSNLQSIPKGGRLFTETVKETHYIVNCSEKGPYSYQIGLNAQYERVTCIARIDAANMCIEAPKVIPSRINITQSSNTKASIVNSHVYIKSQTKLKFSIYNCESKSVNSSDLINKTHDIKTRNDFDKSCASSSNEVFRGSGVNKDNSSDIQDQDRQNQILKEYNQLMSNIYSVDINKCQNVNSFIDFILDNSNDGINHHEQESWVILLTDIEKI